LTDKPRKLLVVDIDGTLLNSDGAISDEDAGALTRACRSGVHVSLSTGRAVAACLPILERLALDGYHMFFDGALVYNQQKAEEVYVEPVPAQLVKQIADAARRQEVNLDLYSITHFFTERETWATDIRRRFFNLKPTVANFDDIWQKERIIKGTIVVRSAEEKARAQDIYQRFKDQLSFSWTITPAYPEVDFINVRATGVSKGKALEALASFLGVPLTDVIAIGDGTNDVSLLSTAGMAIAMGNAHDELKAVADHVTLDVDHNGVAAAVDRFLL
jgi:Cof subfamily protein (haloacid dehalogenase superfamily)